MKSRRTRDPASSQLQFCYSGDDLFRYRTGGLPNGLRSRIFYHLNVEKCQRCRDLFFHTTQFDTRGAPPPIRNRRMIDRLHHEMEKYRACPTPLRLQEGQIWTTSPEPRNERGDVVASIPMAVPVFILSPGTGEKSLQNKIRVLPISNDVGFHLEGETLPLYEDSPLNYPILVEIFNESPMLAGNLGEYRGSVSESRSREIRRLRARYLDGLAQAKADKSFLKWREQEIETARYLSLPVNEAVWLEPGETFAEVSDPGGWHDIVVDIDLMPYKMAADANGMDLSEITPWVLMDTDRLTLAVVQKRDQVVLKMISEEPAPEIFVDGEKTLMDKNTMGLAETVIGYVDSMPEVMGITAVLEGDRFDFQLKFKKRHDP